MTRTRVGYAGGKKLEPTYRSLGGHTEAIEIEFDPTVISYARLLEVFWAAHHPTGRSWSTQYKNVLWTHGEAQAKEAKAQAEALAKKLERKITTEIAPAPRFWVAEDYHQKYYLRRHDDLVFHAFGEDKDEASFRDSELAARLNGWVGGEGSLADRAAETARLKLSPEVISALAVALGESPPPTCGRRE